MTINPTNCANYPCAPNCTAPPCSQLCPNGIAPCWLVTVSGAPLAAYNGTFCLVQQAGPSCVFIDQCSNLYSLTISGGTATLTALPNEATWNAGGSVAGVQFGIFNCNGSNTFTLTSQSSGGNWPGTVTVVPTNCAAVPCFPHCPPPPPPCSGCLTPGHQIAQCWEFSMSGLGNTAGCLCNDYNTTFYMKNTPGAPCDFVMCGSLPGGNTPEMGIGITQFYGNNVWTLVTPTALYTCPLANFNCNGPNVFTQGIVLGTGCTNLPATITVSPSSGCPTNCYCCPNAPSEVTVTISGIAGPGVCDCINGTYTLVGGPISGNTGQCGYGFPNGIGVGLCGGGSAGMSLAFYITNSTAGRVATLYCVIGFVDTSEWGIVYQGPFDCSNGFSLNTCAGSYALSWQPSVNIPAPFSSTPLAFTLCTAGSATASA